MPNKAKTSSLFGELKTFWKSDMISGFLVFLIALPLCLGISKASGFPPIAGIYTAIIGGLVVTFFTGSKLTIKGPAAGLIVIALGCVEEFEHAFPGHGYQLTLAVVVMTGIFQVLAGYIKSGALVDLMPSAAIHGMLASIGITIAAKQIHVALGVQPHGKNPIELIKEIPHSISHMNPELAVIGILSIAILFLLPKIKYRFASLIPGPLLVILIAIPLGLYFELNHDHNYEFVSVFHIDPKEVLVDLPDTFLEGITFPDFSQVLNPISIKYIIMFLLVASIESLLSVKAIDSLDEQKRKSNLNKDLIATGIGNTIVGFIGGLPMISEIVRSSANINNGGKSPWANFFHGVFLFSAVVLIAPIIKLIPNAALAAMLIFTGYRLASPNEFKKTFKIGPDQLVIFVSTIIVTLATDLLIGIAFGITLKFLQHIFFGAPLSGMFKINMQTEKIDNKNYNIKLIDAAVFTNYLGFKKQLDAIPKNSNVELDMSQVVMVDHTFMEHIHEFEDDFSHGGGQVTVKGLENLTPYASHPLSARKLINNAIFAPTKIVYNLRQTQLALLAQQKGFQFDHKRTTSILKFRFAPFLIAKKAQYGENLVMCNSPYCNYIFADIHVEEGALMTKGEYNMTILLVTDVHFVIPDFTLEKTGTFDVLKELGGVTDIDFENFPIFSDEYFLAGEDEEKVRTFFDKNILELFEARKGFYVECKNNSLLIHRNIDLMSTEEIYSTIDFLNDFLEIVHNKSK